jgi:hypothetical protein
MSRRPKFKPEIRRIKLNPEQAVLQCSCYNTWLIVFTATRGGGVVCSGKATFDTCSPGGSTASS